jgi:hypothetical protein
MEGKKSTPWWNNTIKQAIKTKRTLFNKWKNSRNLEDYENYSTARKEVRALIKEAKQKTWTDFGNKISNDFKTETRDFYQTVKTMRTKNENYDPTEIINDKEWNPISNMQEKLNWWKEYFENLLNITPPLNRIEKINQICYDIEPTVLREEIEETPKHAPRNKAPGVDNLPIEIITATGNAGIRWLHRIFHAAWQQQKAPEDWKRAIIIPIWKKKGSKRD